MYILLLFTATFVYAGGWIGNVTCLLSTGLLAASPWGWPSCFYVWGSITILSSLLFFFIGYESPAEHPNIPQDEKQYIESSLGMIETEEVRIFNIFKKYIIAYTFNNIYTYFLQKLSTPWIKILSSRPMWALMVTQSAHTWGFWMLLTKIPSYFQAVFKVNIKEVSKRIVRYIYIYIYAYNF